MAGILGVGKAVDGLNKSVANLDKITTKSLTAVDNIEKTIAAAVDVPLMVAIILLAAAGVSFVLSMERNIIYPGLANAFPAAGEVEELNVRGFLASFIQVLIVAALAGGYLLHRWKRRGE